MSAHMRMNLTFVGHTRMVGDDERAFGLLENVLPLVSSSKDSPGYGFLHAAMTTSSFCVFSWRLLLALFGWLYLVVCWLVSIVLALFCLSRRYLFWILSSLARCRFSFVCAYWLGLVFILSSFCTPRLLFVCIPKQVTVYSHGRFCCHFDMFFQQYVGSVLLLSKLIFSAICPDNLFCWH